MKIQLPLEFLVELIYNQGTVIGKLFIVFSPNIPILEEQNKITIKYLVLFSLNKIKPHPPPLLNS